MTYADHENMKIESVLIIIIKAEVNTAGQGLEVNGQRTCGYGVMVEV